MSASAADDIHLGTILRDTYEIVSLLGTGGMGKVFLARHLRLPSKQVAVKVLLSDEEVKADQYARFRREAEITSRLGHPNIVGILDFHGLEEEGRAPFLVLEYLPGETLSRRLRKGRLPIPEALFIARQVGSALHAAHQAGVIHRDLKPGNIFLVPTESWEAFDYQVKLLDFGISKLASSQTLRTRDDVLLGTPRYMSPEQAKGQNSKVDERSDLFALAVIVYEMLSGKSPFADDTMVGIIYRIVHEAPPSLATLRPELPATVLQAVERALSKQPGDRQPSIAAFIEELTGTLTPSFGPGRSGGAPSALVDSPPPAPLNTGRDPSGPSAASLPATVAGRGSRPALPRLQDTVAPVAPAPLPSPVNAPPEVPLPAAPPAPSPAERRSSRWPVLLGAALALLLGAGGTALVLSRAPPPPSAAPPRETAAAPAPVPLPEAPRQEPRPEQNPPQAEVPEPSRAAAPSPPRATAAAKSSEVLTPEARRILDEAELALDQSKTLEAIRLGLHSQRMQPSGAAHEFLIRAYCQSRDISNTQAHWRAVRTSLTAAQRATVQRYCLRYNIEL